MTVSTYPNNQLVRHSLLPTPLHTAADELLLLLGSAAPQPAACWRLQHAPARGLPPGSADIRHPAPLVAFGSSPVVVIDGVYL